MGHVCVFLTIAKPGKYHPVKVSGQPNPKYNGSTPSEAQAYLNSVWARIRSKLDREQIRTCGLRIVEPHHDGTPHWHLMLFVEPEHKARMVQIMREYALAEDGDEPGAEEARFEAVDIDYDRGSATGYIVKYICKNIDASFRKAARMPRTGMATEPKTLPLALAPGRVSTEYVSFNISADHL